VALPTFHCVSDTAEDATFSPSGNGEVRAAFLLNATCSAKSCKEYGLGGPSDGSSRETAVPSRAWLARDCCILLCCLCKACEGNCRQSTSSVVHFGMRDERLWSVEEGKKISLQLEKARNVLGEAKKKKC